MADFKLSEDLNGAVPVSRKKSGSVQGGIDAPMDKGLNTLWLGGAIFSRSFTRISRNKVEEEFSAWQEGRLASGYAPTIGEDAIASGLQQDDLF